eukprot:gene27180-biopygen3405
MFSEVWEKCSVWKAALRQDDNRVNLTRLSIYFSEVRQGTLRLTAYCMLILIPLYSVLKVYSSSYAIEYAWWISAMLMNGEAAAIVLFVSLMLFAMLYVRTLKGIVMKLNINSYLTILMCFGALFPPLALIAAMSIYSITYFEELWIGWVLTETRGLGLGYGWYEEQIERECHMPDSMENFSKMSQLILRGNNITGTITKSIGNMTELEVLDLSNNGLYGEIPSSIGRLSKLITLNLAVNQLRKIPEELYELSNLRGLSLFNNRIEGLISSRIGNLSSLETLQLQVNAFTPQLIPKEICNLRILKTLDMSTIRLVGPIPDCLFNGLTTSDNCKTALFPGLPYLDGFTVSHFIQGSIPACLFEMPKLQLLHLSGNGLTGSIAQDLNVTESLRDLSLSHNSLTGTIPSSIQLKTWENLDLSYNKLSGTLSGAFSTPFENGAISLEVNRLSGNVPWSLVDFNNTNMLSGNIFSCNFLGTDLPQSDPDASNYSCGSDSVNNVLYTWLGAIICLPLLLMVLLKENVRARSSLEASKRESSMREELTGAVSKLNAWRAALRQDDNRVNLTRLSIYFSEVRQGTLRLTAYCMLILIPLYSVLKVYSSSYAIEYAWWISAMLMNGEAAAIVLFVSLMLFAMLYVRTLKGIVMKLNVRMPKEKRKKEKETSKHERGENGLEIVATYSLIILANVMIMTMADFSYVYIVISFNSLVVTFAALGLALFRLLTNHVLL